MVKDGVAAPHTPAPIPKGRVGTSALAVKGEGVLRCCDQSDPVTIPKERLKSYAKVMIKFRWNADIC